MSNLDVRIVNLEPMHVAAAYGFGTNPEEQAWNKLLAWLKAKGVDAKAQRFFGFNNPSPSAGSPNYGYEQWVITGSEVEADGEIKIKDFSGGLYAVTRCKLSHIGEVWQQLAAWRESSRYQAGQHQWLEEGLTPPIDGFSEEAELDLYLPIR